MIFPNLLSFRLASLELLALKVPTIYLILGLRNYLLLQAIIFERVRYRRAVLLFWKLTRMITFKGSDYHFIAFLAQFFLKFRIDNNVAKVPILSQI